METSKLLLFLFLAHNMEAPGPVELECMSDGPGTCAQELDQVPLPGEPVECAVDDETTNVYCPEEEL
jgi:hypothetical protein